MIDLGVTGCFSDRRIGRGLGGLPSGRLDWAVVPSWIIFSGGSKSYWEVFLSHMVRGYLLRMGRIRRFSYGLPKNGRTKRKGRQQDIRATDGPGHSASMQDYIIYDRTNRFPARISATQPFSITPPEWRPFATVAHAAAVQQWREPRAVTGCGW